jgi:hypothetical protein
MHRIHDIRIKTVIIIIIKNNQNHPILSTPITPSQIQTTIPPSTPPPHLMHINSNITSHLSNPSRRRRRLQQRHIHFTGRHLVPRRCEWEHVSVYYTD